MSLLLLFSGTPDVQVGDGGIRARQGVAAYRRSGSENYYQRRPFPAPPESYTATVAAIQDDDVAAITGTFTDPAYGDGGLRTKQGSTVYRRLASRTPFTRHFQIPPPESYTAVVTVTQDDDVATITGQADNVYTGDGGIRARARHRTLFRPASRFPFLRRPVALPADTTVTGSVTVTQDDDVAAITGTFIDPPYSDGGTRARAQSSVYRRLASRTPFTRHFIVPPVETYTGTVTVTQDDDVAAVTGTFTDPAYGDGGVRARQGSSVYRRLASRIPFTRHFIVPPVETYTGTVTATQDDDTAAITGSFTDPAYGDGGIGARQRSTVYRRLASRVPFLRRIVAPPVESYTAVIAVTQNDDTASVTGTFTDVTVPGDGGIRYRHLAARRARRPVYCQRRYTDVGTVSTDVFGRGELSLDAATMQSTLVGATTTVTLAGPTMAIAIETTDTALDVVEIRKEMDIE